MLIIGIAIGIWINLPTQFKVNELVWSDNSQHEYQNNVVPPSFVGNDYYCESGLPVSQYWEYVLYSDDVLWDGKDCDGDEGECCTPSNMPWFSKSLCEITTEYIEVRSCTNQDILDEDTPLELLELYVRWNNLMH